MALTRAQADQLYAKNIGTGPPRFATYAAMEGAQAAGLLPKGQLSIVHSDLDTNNNIGWISLGGVGTGFNAFGSPGESVESNHTIAQSELATLCTADGLEAGHVYVVADWYEGVEPLFSNSVMHLRAVNDSLLDHRVLVVLSSDEVVTLLYDFATQSLYGYEDYRGNYIRCDKSQTEMPAVIERFPIGLCSRNTLVNCELTWDVLDQSCTFNDNTWTNVHATGTITLDHGGVVTQTVMTDCIIGTLSADGGQITRCQFDNCSISNYLGVWPGCSLVESRFSHCNIGTISITDNSVVDYLTISRATFGNINVDNASLSYTRFSNFLGGLLEVLDSNVVQSAFDYVTANADYIFYDGSSLSNCAFTQSTTSGLTLTGQSLIRVYVQGVVDVDLYQFVDKSHIYINSAVSNLEVPAAVEYNGGSDGTIYLSNSGFARALQVDNGTMSSASQRLLIVTLSDAAVYTGWQLRLDCTTYLRVDGTSGSTEDAIVGVPSDSIVLDPGGWVELRRTQSGQWLYLSSGIYAA